MVDRDDMAARALDALSELERRRFDADADEATRAELAEMQQTAAALAEPLATPAPAALRDRILAQIATTQQVAAPSAAAAPEAPSVAATATEHVPAGPREAAARRRWFQRPVAMLGAAAAAVVLLVAGVGIGQAIRTPDPVSALVHAADVSTQTEDMGDGTQATLMWSHEQGEVALVFQGLSALEAEQVYEAWFVRDGQPIAAGIFDGGDGSVVHMLDGELHEGDSVAVTIEPAGGSEQPTSTPMLVMST